MTNPLTTATSVGVALRYAITIAGAMATILSIIGLLTPEQATALTRTVQDVSKELPGLIAAIAGLMTVCAPLYAIVTKSHSDKAAEAAKQIDAKIPADDQVFIPTPSGQADIIVAPTKRARRGK